MSYTTWDNVKEMLDIEMTESQDIAMRTVTYKIYSKKLDVKYHRTCDMDYMNLLIQHRILSANPETIWDSIIKEFINNDRIKNIFGDIKL